MIEAAEAIQVESGSRNEPPRGIRFMKLREGLCKFPLGGPYDPPERFCGEPAPVGSPYCPACQRIAYTGAMPVSRNSQRYIRNRGISVVRVGDPASA